MNILFLLRLWPIYGGGETVTICLANEMVKRGWNVSVVFFKHTERMQMPFIDDRIQRLYLSGIDCNEFIMNPRDANRAQDAVIEYVRSNNIEFIINQWWIASYITRLKAETGAKLITCLHQAFYTPVLDQKGFKGYVRRLLKPIYVQWRKKSNVKSVMRFLPYVDKYVFLSPAFQHQFEEFAHYNNSNSKLDSIPNPTVFTHIISEQDYVLKEKAVLIVARMLEGQKRLTRALRIWKRIEAHSYSADWHLQMVGEGPDLPMYKQMAADLGLKRISFEGFQQPLEYYKKAMIFLMTSQFEGFAMTLVEAQQQGCVPVVMDSFLSLHDIIIDKENGIITSNLDEVSFAHAVLKLMSDAQLRDKLAKCGMQTCLRFSVEKIVDRWNILLKGIK